MNNDSRPAVPADEEYGPGREPCPVCLKLISEYRNAGMKIPGCILCAYGHRLADYPVIHPAPERLPAWAWTAPRRKGA